MTLYVSLHTAEPGDDQLHAEASFPSYARLGFSQEIDLDFPTQPDGVTVTHFAIGEQPEGSGTVLGWGEFPVPVRPGHLARVRPFIVEKTPPKCEACGGNGFSGGKVVEHPEMEDACELCLGSGKAKVEHDFGGPFGSCRGCGKYVEELIDERYCTPNGGARPATQDGVRS